MKLESHEQCPGCGHQALPRIYPGSKANARMCQNCNAVVDRDGKLEIPIYMAAVQ